MNNDTASDGGAIANEGRMRVTNSTFHGNTALIGGALVNAADGVLTVTHCTLAGNVGRYGAGGLANKGTVTLRSTILAASSGGNCANGGTLTDAGYNLEDNNTCGFSAEKHSLVNTDPLLSPPGSYTGRAPTLALLPNSPAIDLIPYGTNGCGSNVAFDQRGIRRPQGAWSECDAGAFESRGFILRKMSGDHQSTPVLLGFALPLRLLVASPYSEPVEKGQVTFTGPESGAGTDPPVNTAVISRSGGVIQTMAANETPGRYWVAGDARGSERQVFYDLKNTDRP